MTLLQIMKYLNFKVNKRSLFDIDITKQSAFLRKFDKPKDLKERSYFQYICQNMLNGRLHTLLYNIASFFLVLPIIAKFMVNQNKVIINTSVDAVSTMDFRKAELLGKSLNNEFNTIVEINSLPGKLDMNDIKYIMSIIKRYPFSPYFYLKCISRIALYSDAIKTYNPKAVLAYAEYSYTSSILTEYCRKNNVQHINIMHGEKLFDIRDSFVCFDRYYVWDQHYINLLITLGADVNKFIIELPNALYLDIKKNIEYLYDMTYYLGSESESDLLKICKSLKSTGIKLDKICIRYHPRYSNISRIKSIFNGFVIEDPNKVKLSDSLSMSRYIVSLYSTVLFQALLSDKDIIVDDTSNISNYQKLQEMMYIVLNKPHILMSDFINNCN